MDYALTEAQQQQQQQYQPSDHQATAQSYDFAQAQSYEAYSSSSYHHPQYDPSAYHHHYYPYDYSYQHLPPPAAHADPVPVPVPVPHDPSHIHPPQPHHHLATTAGPAGGHGYHPPPEQQAPGSSATSAEASYPVPPGMNPAAMADLTQFAGTMDAAERAMAGMQDRSWHGKNGGIMGPGGPPLLHHPHHPQPAPHHPHHPPPAPHHPRHPPPAIHHPHHPPPVPHHPYHSHHQPHPPQLHPMQHGAVSIKPGGGASSPYKGGGRSNGGSSRGGGGAGRGSFGYHPPRQDVGTAALVRGRGRGRGRGRMGRGRSRRFQQSAADSHQPNAAPASVTEPSSVPEIKQGPGQAPSQSSALAAVPAPMLGRHPLLPIAWCDTCRVDCNSLEILEQHKNGKRHKRTVQRVQEIQAQQKLMAELQGNIAVKPEMILQKTEENKAAEVIEAKKAFTSSKNMQSAVLPNQIIEVNKASTASENTTAAEFCDQVIEAGKGSASSEKLPDAIAAMEHETELEMQSKNVDGHSEHAKEGEEGAEAALSDALDTKAPQKEGHTKRPRMDECDQHERRHGPKRKMMRFGRGGKRLRSFEPVRRKRPERPREQPRVCTLCNVTCDTLAVFECHLSGKKHLSRIKRFQGQDSVYGPVSVYIPPNQPTNYSPQAPQPLFYGLKSHEMLQQEAYGLQELQAEGYGLQQGNQAKQPTEAEGPVLVSQAGQSVEHPDNEIPVDGSLEAVTMNIERQTAVSEPEEKEPSQSLPAVSGFEEKEPSPSPMVLETATMEEGAAHPDTEDVVLLPAHGATLGDNVVLPGLDARDEEPNAKNREPGSGVNMASQ